MKRAILTGFEPFGPYRFNPTKDAALEYDGKRISGIEITGLVLPCSYYGAFDILREVIHQLSPDIIINTGLASRVRQIRIETIGRNIMNGKYPDAEGYHPDNETIIADGNPWYKTNTDGTHLMASLYGYGIPAEVSADAEGFVCNSLLYLTARHIEEGDLPVRHAFFHAPWTDDYIDRVYIEPWKATISKYDLMKSIEVLLGNMQ